MKAIRQRNGDFSTVRNGSFICPLEPAKALSKEDLLALLQKLPKFLNCGQLFDNRPRWQPKKDADRVQGFFGFHVRI